MIFSKNFLWISVIYMIILQMIQGQSQHLSLLKTPQFPSNTISDQFSIEVSDKVLVDIKQVDSTYKYFIYNGDRFDNLVTSYEYNLGIVNDISFSDDSIFEIKNSRTISSLPYQKKITLNIPNVTSILSINQEVKLLSARNSSTDCQYLVALKEFQDDTQKTIFDQDEKNCFKNDATLTDLGNDLIAHQKYDTVDIWNKKDFTKKLDSINISGNSYRSQINDFKTFYNPLTNYSMFVVKAGSSDNHTIFEYNLTDKKYHKKTQFYYNGECHYHNQSFCVSVQGKYLKVNQNIDKQIISQKISDPSLAYLKDNVFFEMAHSSKYIVGFNKTGSKLNIFNAGYDYIDLNKSIQNTSCVSQAKFTYEDSDIIYLQDNCDNKTTNNLCLASPDSDKTPCFKLTDDKSDFNITGFIQITKHSDVRVQGLNRICATKVKLYNNSYGIECRTSSNLAPLPKVQIYLQNLTQNQKIINAKILHSPEMNENFWVAVSLIDSDNITKNFTHKYKLEFIAIEDKFNITRKEQIKEFNSSFQLIGVHKENLISFHSINGSTNYCALYYFDLQGLQIERLNYPCQDLERDYRLILQQGYDQACIQLLSGDRRIDCYKREDKLKMTKKQIPVPIFNDNFTYYQPIINTLRNEMIFYQTKSDNPSYVILDISILPIFRASINSYQSTSVYPYKHQFAYRPPQGIKEQDKEEILAFTHYQSLYKLRNIVQTMKKIELEKRPQNYLFPSQRFTLYHPNPDILIYEQKTFLASTGYHLIVAMYTDNNHTTMTYLQLEQNIIENKFYPIWNYTVLTLIDNVDIGWNTFAISSDFDSVELRTFQFSKQIEQHELYKQGDKFEKVKVTNDDRLIYTIHKAIENKSVLYFIPSILKKQSYPVKLNHSENILDFLISPSQNAFVVRTQGFIQFAQYNNTGNSNQMPIPSGFVDMYLTNLKTTTTSTKVKSNKPNSKLPNSQHMSPSALKHLSKFNQIKQFEIQELNEPNDLQIQTVIIRTDNYTLFCSTSLKMSECGRTQSIKGSAIFAANQEGNMIAYVWADGDKKEWVHVMRVRAYGAVDSIQNISLKQLQTINSNLMYTPTIVNLFISANDTLYILTQSKDNSSQFYPIFYVYTSKPCGTGKQSVNQECVCKPYYWANNTYKNGSKVTEFVDCNCKYFDNKTSGQCECPTWNHYQQETDSCHCPDGRQEDWSGDIGFFCEEKHFPWYGYLLIVLGALVLGLIAYCIWKYCGCGCCCCLKDDQGYLLHEEDDGSIKSMEEIQQSKKRLQKEKKDRQQMDKKEKEKKQLEKGKRNLTTIKRVD